MRFTLSTASTPIATNMTSPKHPEHRIGDVLRWHPEARDEVYNFVRGVVDEHLPQWIKDLLHEIQQVGSMTWGGATLRSDVDFNLCLKKDVSLYDYAKARRWYYSKHREAFQRAIDNYEYHIAGLHIDIGMLDWETDAYNTYVSLKEMKLYHRRDDLLDDWIPNDVGEYPIFIDQNPIDLLTFDPKVDEVPTPKDQHLTWDGYKERWRKDRRDRPWKNNPAWSEDRWAELVPFWREYYGKHFQECRWDGNQLIPA